MQCNICKKKKTLTDFGANIDPVYICKTCRTNFKKCPKCEYSQHASSFYGDASSKSGLQCWCKSCNNRARKLRRFGETKTAGFVNFKRDAEELMDIKSNSTDLESYDI